MGCKPPTRRDNARSELEILPFGYDSELGGQPYAAQRRVATQERQRPVAIQLPNREPLRWRLWRLDEHDAVRAYTGRTRTDSADNLGYFQTPSGLRARIHEHEIIARSRELVERSAVFGHQSFPVSAHQRSRHT